MNESQYDAIHSYLKQQGEEGVQAELHAAKILRELPARAVIGPTLSPLPAKCPRRKPIMDEQCATRADAQKKARMLAERWVRDSEGWERRRKKPYTPAEKSAAYQWRFRAYRDMLKECARDLEIAFGLKEDPEGL